MILILGEDFDRRVIDHLIAVFRKQEGLDLTTSPRAISRLRREVEGAKRILST
ncbi:heat shock protein 70 family protein, partial [Kipferlia bialata]|eukprot:g16391.t1